MKLLVVYGSPRKNGNSATLADIFIEGFKDKYPEGEVEKTYLIDKKISGCVACKVCKNVTPQQCAIKDDMQDIYKQIRKADAILLASPLYWYGVSAQAKTFTDRFYAFLYEKELSGKKFFTIVTGISELPNKGYELIEDTYREITRDFEMPYKGLSVSAHDNAPVSENDEATKAAYELGFGI